MIMMKLKFSNISQQSQYGYGRMMSFSQRSFAGGINYSVLPTGIDVTKEVIDCSNVFVGLDNLLRVRYGTSLLYSSGESGFVQGIAMYDGQVVYAVNGKVFVGNTHVGDCAQGGRVTFLNYKSNLYILDGDLLKRYTGTTYEVVPNAPKCQYGVTHHNRMWVVGDPDNPSRLWISGVNDDEDWGSTGYQLGSYVDIDPFEDSKITGIGLFFDSIVIFKDSLIPRIYRVDGFPMVLDSSMYQVTNPLTVTVLLDNISSINPDTVCMTPLGVIFLSKDGLYALDVQKGNIMPISNNINRELLSSSFDYEHAVATFYPNFGLYIIASNDTAFVYNIYSKGWFKWHFDAYNVEYVTSVNGELFFGNDSGEVYKWDSSTAKDGDTDVAVSISTGYYEFDTPAISKYVSEAYLVLNTSTSGKVTVEFKPNYANIYGIGTETLYNIDGTTVHYQSTQAYGLGSNTLKYTLNTESVTSGFDDPNFGFDLSSTVGFDGRVNKPYLYKIPVNVRCTNLGIDITFSGFLAEIQQLDLVYYLISKTP